MKQDNPSFIGGKGGMDMEGIVQIIQSLGFPIACVCAMFLMWQKEVKSHDEEMEKMRAALAEQTRATTEALNGNTVILTKILTRIGAEDNDYR